jgi:hypothetical protein
MVIFCQDDIILSQGEQFCAEMIRTVSARVISNHLKQFSNLLVPGRVAAGLIGQA